MLKMFKYELIVLVLAFSALQYGRVQNNSTAISTFLQNDHSEEEAQSLSDWTDGAEIRASVDETNITAMEQFLGVSASVDNDHLFAEVCFNI